VEKHKIRKISVTLIISLIMLMIVGYVYVLNVQAQPSEPHPANALWIEPSTMEIDTGAVDPGYKFNITVWLNLTADAFTWQVKVFFNMTYLNATKMGYTAGATSEWITHRTGGMIIPVSPTIDNVNGFVLHGESCMGDDYVPSGTYGSLIWIEFVLKQEPPVCQYLTLNFSVPYGEDTFALDSDMGTVTMDTVGDNVIHIIPEFPSETILLILAMLTTVAVIAIRKRK